MALPAIVKAFPDRTIVAVTVSQEGDSVTSFQKDGLQVWQVKPLGVARKAIVVREKQWVIVGMSAEREVAEQLLIYDKNGTLIRRLRTGQSAQPDWVRAGKFSVMDLVIVPSQQGREVLVAVLLYDSRGLLQEWKHMTSTGISEERGIGISEERGIGILEDWENSNLCS